MKRRGWTICLAMFSPLAWGGGEMACPDPGAGLQAPMEGPVRKGYFRVIEVPVGRAGECWLAEGRRALEAGRFDEAGRAFLKAWRDGREKTTALLGLAAVAVRQGRMEEARSRYRQVLRYDPANPRALAGLSIVAGDDPELLATLERIARERPPRPEVYFALGNLYARRIDWPKAQSAYFQAYHLDRDDPTYAYNLAVSLDQLGKRTLARRFYRRALDLAQLRFAGFDREAVRRRLNRLAGSGS